MQSSPKARAWSGVVRGKVEDGGASMDSVEARWLGVGFTTLGASRSPSATLCRRSRGGGSVVGAIDDGVANMADGGAGWCSSDHRNQGKMSQEVV
jgi:hypothetical protein